MRMLARWEGDNHQWVKGVPAGATPLATSPLISLDYQILQHTDAQSPRLILHSTQSSQLVLNSTQIMDYLNEDFRAARQRVAQLLLWLDNAFELAQQGTGFATDDFNSFFSAEDHHGAQAAMDGHEMWISSCSNLLDLGRGVAERLEFTQAPWLAACSAYLRKAKRYWRAESGVATPPIKKEQEEAAAVSSLSAAADPESKDGPYAEWTQSGTNKIVVRKRGKKQPLHTFVRLPEQQTTEFGDLNVFEPEVSDIGKDVSMIKFYPPSRDVLLRVAYKEGLERWIVVATQCPLVAREG